MTKKKNKPKKEDFESFAEKVEPFVDLEQIHRLYMQAQMGALVGILVKKKIITADEYEEVLSEMLSVVATGVEEDPVPSEYFEDGSE